MGKFILVGDKLINTKYIKMITPTHLVVANTEHVSITSAHMQMREKNDIKILITTDVYAILLKQVGGHQTIE